MLRIRELRQKARISQTDLAKVVGISRQSLWNYENDFAEPNISTLAKIAIVLEFSVDDLIDFKKIHDELSEDILEMIQQTKKPIL